MPISRPERDRQVQRVLLIEGGINCVIFSLKAVVGVMTGSLAILSDAAHSLADIANNAVAWIVMRVAARPPDREHPYGHRKFETLAVFGLATLLTVIAVEIALQALRRQSPQILDHRVGLILMLIVLGTNILLSLWERYWAKRLDSDLLRADASHTLSDVLTTTVVLVGWQLSAAGYVWLDTVCALGVAVLIFFLAFALFQRVVPILVDHLALEPEDVINAVGAVTGVQEVRRVRSRWIGDERRVDLIITVDSQLSTGDAHNIANDVEDVLAEVFGVEDSTVHVEPHLESRLEANS
ncbi:MAG: cation diffusion facilitator family transporter [Pseudomonadota bacterium]